MIDFAGRFIRVARLRRVAVLNSILLKVSLHVALSLCYQRCTNLSNAKYGTLQDTKIELFFVIAKKGTRS